MKRRFALLGALLCLMLPLLAGAEVPDVPGNGGETYVFDYADVVTNAHTQTMDTYADALYGETGATAVCVRVDFLDGMSIEDYAQELFNSWGIGDSSNNGVLLLFARGEKQIYIATGKGLAERLTDDAVGQLLDDYAMPYLLDGDYSTGIRVVFIQLCREVAQLEDKILTEPLETASGTGK